MRRKSSFVIWSEYLVARVLLAGVRCVPPSWKEPVCTVAARVGFTVLRRPRRRAIEHVLFTGIARTPREARSIALRSFAHMAMTGFEILKLDQLTARWPLEESVTIAWDERWEKIAASEKGYIVLSAHYGNWELSSSVAVNVFRKPLHVLARPLANPRIDELLMRMRARDGVTVHSKIGGTRHLLRALSAGSSVGVLVDQRAHNREGGITLRFLNRETRAYSVPAQIHFKADAPVFVAILRRRPGPFRFEFVLRGPYRIEPSGDRDRDAEALVRLYSGEIEAIIREDPTQWLWSHRLWDGVSRERRHRRRTRHGSRSTAP